MTECPSTPASPRPAARRSTAERDPLMQHEYDGPEADGTTVGESLNGRETKPVAGGTILGIHNLAIVMPQFIVGVILVCLARAHTMSHAQQIAIVASIIFRIVDESAPSNPLPSPLPENVFASGGLDDHTTYYGKNGVAWVLRFGGFCTLLGAAFARMVPPTRAEKETRDAFRALKALKAEEEEA